MVYVDLPFLSSSQLTDGSAYFNLPIMIGNSRVTIRELEIPIYITKPVEENFVMNLRNKDGSLVTGGFERFTIQFSHEFTGN